MELLQRLLYTTCGAAAAFYFVVKFCLSYWKKRGILHEKPKFLWGNLKGVGQQQHISTILQLLYAKYKGRAPFIGFYAFVRPMVYIVDADVIARILGEDAEYFTDRGLYCNIAGDPLSANLMQLDGEQWSGLRDKLTSCFSAEKLSSVLPTLERVASTFGRSLAAEQRERKEFVINELVACYNEDVISALAFGLEGDSLRHPYTKFRLMTRAYAGNCSLVQAFLAFTFPSIARLLQYRMYDQCCSDYFIKLVDERLQEREGTGSLQQHDFLKLFAELREPRLNSKQVAAQAFSFILSSLDACNSTLTFCLYELALHPDIQRQAQEEITRVLKKYDNQVNMQSLAAMSYSKQILNETLRKHSPYVALLRNTTKDYEVPGTVFMLQKDNHAIIPIAALHHDPSIYPEPQKFDPDRFTETSIRQRPPMTFLPFGRGPRNCIAQQFAELQLLVGLVTLLREYTFSPCADTAIPLEYDRRKLILTPQCDVKLHVKRVES